MKDLKNSCLLIIDAQEGIKDEAHWGGNRNNPAAEHNIETLLNHWKTLALPVVVVQHCSVSETSPFRPGALGNKLMPFVEGEMVIQKSTANAFVNTNLSEYLKGNNISSLVIAGFVTNNSVEATARYAGDVGFNTIVVADATACFDKIGLDGKKYYSDVVHQLSLANLKDEYATIMYAQEILDHITATNLKSTIHQSKIE
jgi:nicotinamidase-related amidase